MRPNGVFGKTSIMFERVLNTHFPLTSTLDKLEYFDGDSDIYVFIFITFQYFIRPQFKVGVTVEYEVSKVTY